MNSFKNKVFFSTILLAMLSACGGGSSTPVTVTPPAVVVAPPTPVSLMKVTMAETTGAVGSPYTVTWAGTNVANCTASGAWSGALAVTGSQSVTPTTEGTNNYTVTCGSITGTVALNVLPQFTAIPDANFEAALIGAGVDDVLDGKVSTAKALTITKMGISTEGYLPPGFYDATGKQIPLTAVFGTAMLPKIKSIVGIEAFANLNQLQIENQQVATVDLSKLVNLKSLSLWQEPITSIDLSKNLKMETLGLSETSLKTVDISMLTSLIEIAFQNDIVPLPYTLGNGTTVYGFTTLDLTKNVNLLRIYLYGNGMTSLDLSGNKKLQEFYASANKFQSFDFRGFKDLNSIVLDNNNLNYLNISGINGNVSPSRLYTDGNPNLTEIHVTNTAVINDLNSLRAVGRGIFTNSAPLQVTNFVL